MSDTSDDAKQAEDESQPPERRDDDEAPPEADWTPTPDEIAQA